MTGLQRAFAIFVMLGGVVLPAPSSASCRPASPYAIACLSPGNAAIAYQDFRSNWSKIRTSNVEAYLHGYGCGTPLWRVYRTAMIEKISTTHIPLPSGWITIFQVMVNHNYIYQIAAPYLRGECQEFKPLPENALPGQPCRACSPAFQRFVHPH